MDRWLSRALLTLPAVTVMAWGNPLAAARPSQKAALVTVVSKDGKPVRDLKAADFVVKEDGSKREVVDAQLSDEPLSIVVLIDTTQPPMSSLPPTQDLRASMAAFTKDVLSVTPAAQISLEEFAGAAVVTVPFTSSPTVLDNAIGRLYPNQQTVAILLEALADAGKKLGERPAPRRAIVSIDFNSPEGSAERTMKDAVDSIHASGATLWAASVRGSAITTPIREEVLTKVTKANGGMRFSSVDASGLEGMMHTIAASLTSQYIVSFVHPGDGAAKAVTFESARGQTVLLTPFMR